MTHKRFGWIAVGLIAVGWLLGLRMVGNAAAQEDYAAVVNVTFRGVEIRLANTERWLSLSAGSQAPLGAGDALRTDNTGRAFVTFEDAVTMLIMPGSTFEILEYDVDEGIRLAARLDGGHLAQQLAPTADLNTYRLTTERVVVTDPAEAYAVWERPEQPTYVTVADGAVELTVDGSPVMVAAGEGLRVTDDAAEAPLTFDPPWNAPRIEGLLEGCDGMVNTLSLTNLNLRVAPNLGDTLFGSIPNLTPVKVMGATPYREWHRIQVLSVFAWVEGPALKTDCGELPELSYFSVERNNSILEVTEAELELLEPFYGLPEDDTLFYLYLREE